MRCIGKSEILNAFVFLLHIFLFDRLFAEQAACYIKFFANLPGSLAVSERVNVAGAPCQFST